MRARTAGAVEGSPESTGLVDTPARAAQHAAQRALAAFTLPPAAAAYVELARPRFVAKACGMVLASAAAAAQSPAAVLEPTVWAAAAVTALITAGSMMVNDYFDWKAGVDAVNDPGRAIPRCVPTCRFWPGLRVHLETVNTCQHPNHADSRNPLDA